MPLENNRYGGTAADLSQRRVEENQVTDEMIRMIIKAGKWSRVISYATFLIIIFLILAIIPIAMIFLKLPGIAIPVIISYGILIYVVWAIYTTTKQYANIARHLDDSSDQIEDIATCFELHTRFIKIISLVIIIIFVLGILAAIALPAYQGYLSRMTH